MVLFNCRPERIHLLMHRLEMCCAIVHSIKEELIFSFEIVRLVVLSDPSYRIIKPIGFLYSIIFCVVFHILLVLMISKLIYF